MRHGPAGKAAVVVAFPRDDPALAALGLDVGLARLALGVEAVEILLQPLLRRPSRLMASSQILMVKVDGGETLA